MAEAVCYIVSYDLNGGSEEEYQSLYEAIKSYGIWAKITESTWALVATNTAIEVRDNLQKHMKQNDRVFVIKSGVEAAWANVKCRNQWLQEHL